MDAGQNNPMNKNRKAWTEFIKGGKKQPAADEPKKAKKPPKGIAGEDRLQADICNTLDLFGITYYSVPNGSNKVSDFLRKLFKKTGLKKGVPDLHIPEPIYQKPCVDRITVPPGQSTAILLFLSLYVEVKMPGKYPDKEQKAWHEKLRKLGHRVEVVRSVDEVISIIKNCYPDKYMALAGKASNLEQFFCKG
jgi:hypothetical protein